MSTSQDINVSVVIPCFNQGKFLPDALDCALNQTIDRKEVILVDDGSTDKQTVDLINSTSNPKLHKIVQSNQGPSAARNKGISKAQGKYILTLDADDKIDTSFAQKAFEILERDANIGIVYTKAILFGKVEEPWDIPEYSFPSILLGNGIGSAAVFRREDWKQAGGYSTEMVEGWEDYEFYLSVIELGRSVVRIPEALYFYRQAEDSRTSKLNPEIELRLFRTIVKRHPRLYKDNVSFILEEYVKLRNLLFTDRPLTLKEEMDKISNELRQSQAELEIARRTIKNMERTKLWRFRKWLLDLSGKKQ